MECFLCKELEGQPGRPKNEKVKKFDEVMWNNCVQFLNVRKKVVVLNIKTLI